MKKGRTINFPLFFHFRKLGIKWGNFHIGKIRDFTSDLQFKGSPERSVGLEIELQVIDPDRFDLCSKSKKVLEFIKKHSLKSHITPEITQSMIEINSSIHRDIAGLYEEMRTLKRLLSDCSQMLNIRFSGGGTHPFQHWASRKIYPAGRYLSLSDQYGYLAKMFTVFGMHIHLGCANGEEAVQLIHALSLYVPHFIALSASSPFYQGIDSSFDSARIPTLDIFPLSGIMPSKRNWQEMVRYFKEMNRLGIASTFKDYYWDIRPRPDYGTIEVRICDMPLTLETAVSICAYVYYLSQYLLNQKNDLDFEKLYLPYAYNRFQACRYGLKGQIVNPYTYQTHTIDDQIIATLRRMKNSIPLRGKNPFMKWIRHRVKKKENDSAWLRKKYCETKSLPGLVHLQTDLWEISDLVSPDPSFA